MDIKDLNKITQHFVQYGKDEQLGHKFFHKENDNFKIIITPDKELYQLNTDHEPWGVELDTIDNLKIRFKSFTGENLNISSVSESKSKSYMDEVKKQNILDDLKRIENYVSVLHNMIEKSNYLDDDTKQNILGLRETSHQIYNQEMDKELKRQKKDGKEFLSDSDVDDLIDKIKHEVCRPYYPLDKR